ncbi:MAG: RNA polymerase sigma factor [Pirellulaceae bacterium]
MPLSLDWRQLLASHDRWLRTVVFARLRDNEAVDEVMQEIAVAAVRQAAPLADASKVAPWLYRLAVRQVLLYRRKLGRRRKLLDRYTVKRPPREGTDEEPLHWLLAQERQQLIRRAMETLPARDAEMLMLKYSEDWSYEQIATHLGISESAVEARLHRARKRLRTALGTAQVVEVGK